MQQKQDASVKMDQERIALLLKECEEKQFWGSLKFIFTDGKITHLLVEQTVKQGQQQLIIIRE